MAKASMFYFSVLDEKNLNSNEEGREKPHQIEHISWKINEGDKKIDKFLVKLRAAKKKLTDFWMMIMRATEKNKQKNMFSWINVFLSPEMNWGFLNVFLSPFFEKRQQSSAGP